MADPTVRYLVFDVESVADGDLIARVRYPSKSLAAADAIRLYRDELLEKTQSDFIPYTYQVPVAVAIAKVTEDFRLLDLVTLDEPDFRSHIITRHFWKGWEAYQQPTLVSFNGRAFDLPLLELAAFRYGLAVPKWFALEKKWDQPRNRYNQQSHFDLHELLVNFGATRFNGGLNLAANLLGKPGKLDIQGYMVQDLYDVGKRTEINDYCRCDVLDTYFVFLRSMVLVGRMDLAQEQDRIQEAKTWIADRRDQCAAFEQYLGAWGDWPNPW